MTKIVLDCQKCGGTLEITDDMEIFRCEYCGMPYLVKRSDGGIQITQLVERVSRVEDEQNRLRIDMLASDIRQLHKEIGNLFRSLSDEDSMKSDKIWKDASGTELQEEEWRLRRQYLELGGDDPEITEFKNPAEVVYLWKSLHPDAKMEATYGWVWIPFGDSYVCPAVDKPNALWKAGQVQFRNADIRVSMKKPYREQMVSLLRKRYPGSKIR